MVFAFVLQLCLLGRFALSVVCGQAALYLKTDYQKETNRPEHRRNEGTVGVLVPQKVTGGDGKNYRKHLENSNDH
jgi:hypothetical protein